VNLKKEKGDKTYFLIINWSARINGPYQQLRGLSNRGACKERATDEREKSGEDYGKPEKRRNHQRSLNYISKGFKSLERGQNPRVREKIPGAGKCCASPIP